MPVASLMKLARGAVISLDQRVGDPVDIVVNGKVVARGEIVVVDEVSQRFGVSLLEIVGGREPRTSRLRNERIHVRAHDRKRTRFSAVPRKPRLCC